MSQSSQRDVGDFSPSNRSQAAPTAKASVPPSPPNNDNWGLLVEQNKLLRDTLDQIAVSKLYSDGIYKNARYQAKALQKIADQAELQTRYQRQIFYYLAFTMIFQLITLVALGAVASRVLIR